MKQPVFASSQIRLEARIAAYERPYDPSGATYDEPRRTISGRKRKSSTATPIRSTTSPGLRCAIS